MYSGVSKYYYYYYNECKGMTVSMNSGRIMVMGWWGRGGVLVGRVGWIYGLEPGIGNVLSKEHRILWKHW